MQRFSIPTLFYIIGLFLLLITPQTAVGQLYHIDKIQESDGLPSPDIKSITQDRWGMVWIATRGGIAFHDGLNWKKANLDSLVSDVSNGLLEVDPQGDVWALLTGRQPTLLRHSFSNWNEVPLPAGLTFSHLKFTNFALAGVKEETVAAITLEPNKMYVSSNNGWQQVPLKSQAITVINCMLAVDGNFILATPQGTFTISASNPTIVKPLLESPPASPALSMSWNRSDKSLWMVGMNWIGTWDQGVFNYLVPPTGETFKCFSDPSTKTCQTDGFGGIYLSGIFSTQYYHPKIGMEVSFLKNSYVEFGTTDFFLDRELVLWQGSSQGINKIFSRHAKGYNKSQGLLGDEVTAILQRHDGTIVLGHQRGLTFFDEQKHTFSFSEYDPRDRVLDLDEDSKGNIWIAGRQRGLERLSPDGAIKQSELGLEESNYVTTVLVDDQDRVWIGASNKLLILENDQVSEYPLHLHLEKGFYIRRLIKGRHGIIYIATSNCGLIAINDTHVQQWSTEWDTNKNSIFDVFESADGNTWVGTRDGLFQLAGDELVRPSEVQYNFNRPVYFIEIDQRNRMWLGTDNGVLRIDGDQAVPLTVEDGMIGRETNRCASLVDSEGRFWVGTERGLTIFDDLFENTAPLSPLVNLIGLDANGEHYPLCNGLSEISLPAQSNNLVFQYRVFTTKEPKRINILTRLDGLDSQWLEHTTAGEQIIRYNHIPPGTYQFHVKAAGFGQPWSDVANSPEIFLQAPIWQQTWFLAVTGLTLLIFLGLPIVFIVQRRYTIHLQHEVATQLEANRRIESELEQARNLESLGVLAGGIAHDFNNLLTVVFGNLSLMGIDKNLDSSQQECLLAATSAIERTRGLTNQLLTFSKGGAPILEVGSLASLVQESAQFVLHGSNSKCHFDLPSDLWSVEMDSNQMSQVVNNLLINALEAMPSGGDVILKGRNRELESGLLAAGKYVEITVIDNGLGISKNDLPKIFDPYFTTKDTSSGLGLATAFSILDRHKGRLSVDSTLGRGAAFKLLVPSSNANISDQEHIINPPAHSINGTILILDDDPDVRNSMEQMLARLGMKVESTAEGSQTIKQYHTMYKQGCPPDIVLLDLTIPGGLGGQEIIGSLLAINPEAKAIVISGYSQSPVISQYETHGFKAAIAKPIRIDELGNVLRRVLAD